jgi:hypothetical protein
MATSETDNMSKKFPRFYCECCDYGTSKKSSFDEHLLSGKHSVRNKMKQKYGKILPKTYSCEHCFKIFENRTTLWRHKKKCTDKDTTNCGNELKGGNGTGNDSLNLDLINLITELVKSNNELQQSILEICKNRTNNSTNNTNTTTNINSNNKSFNIQLFLNETCKDAMNIMDFVDSIQLQLSDLEKVGELGYVEGISNIIVQNLTSLDVTQRPIHCTDKKREVLYVKDQNKWEKEDKENNKVRKVIKKVSHKNSSLLRDFREKYPDYRKSESEVSDKYDKLVIEAMGGKGNNDTEKENKIIRNISKRVCIEKGTNHEEISE